MADNQIEEIKSKTDIVSLLSEYIELKKAGRNYKANCPFHGEKTPSFMVSSELQMYKCFGCGKSGDIFTFLEEHEGMEFGEALKYLADKVGITLKSFKNEKTSEREKIIEINKSCLNFYNYVLNSHPSGKRVLEYLKKDRGLTDETIELFKIGYSPESYDALSKYLVQKKKFVVKDLQLSGMLVGRGIDRFRGRLIFPLFDHRDNVVGFAGRIMPWMKQDTAKYINSPDTPAYHKSKILYGLNITKSFIREEKTAVVVEGEVDTISCFQVGVKNVIAIKGSALTEDQIRLIGRFAKTIILCLDSDFAGDEAAKRGAIIASNLGFEVKVAHLEGYKDPNELIKKEPSKLKTSIDNAIPIWDFLINSAVNKYGLDTGEDKKKISFEIVPILASIEDKIVQAHYVSYLAQKLSVPVEAVFQELDKKVPSVKREETNSFEVKEKTRKELLEEKLLISIVLNNSELIHDDSIIELIDSEFIKKVIYYLRDNKMPLPAELSSGYQEIILSNSEDENIETIIRELTILSLKNKLEDLGKRIKIDDSDEKLLKEFSQISKKLSTL